MHTRLMGEERLQLQLQSDRIGNVFVRIPRSRSGRANRELVSDQNRVRTQT